MVLDSLAVRLAGLRRGQWRAVTRTHRRLISELGSRPDPSWSEKALHACLHALCVRPEAIWVQDAWTEGERTFCIVYRYPEFRGTLGLRRQYDDEDSEWFDAADPDSSGSNVALFDVLEPLGTVETRLRPDADGVRWWGSPPEPQARR